MAISIDAEKLAALRERLKAVEGEVAELRALLARAESGNGGVTMAELHGAWGGRLNASEEDFAAVEFSMKWLDEPGT
jgi:hypothetical protein